MIHSAVWAHIQDRLGDEDLAGKLRHWKSADVPAEAMARMIAVETGVRPSGETIRRWLRHLNGHAA